MRERDLEWLRWESGFDVWLWLKLEISKHQSGVETTCNNFEISLHGPLCIELEICSFFECKGYNVLVKYISDFYMTT